jgi:glyoxylase I family protein
MSAQLPTRLHHNAYVTKDMEATRHFYEDLIGMPLVATWCESDELFGKLRTYCHCFFGLADGSALAFFQFANQDDQAQFGPPMPASPFIHIALNVDAQTQSQVEARIKKAGIREPNFYVLEHGYCRSIYATDPNGMILELTTDNPEAAAGGNQRRVGPR